MKIDVVAGEKIKRKVEIVKKTVHTIRTIVATYAISYIMMMMKTTTTSSSSLSLSLLLLFVKKMIFKTKESDYQSVSANSFMHLLVFY